MGQHPIIGADYLSSDIQLRIQEILETYLAQYRYMFDHVFVDIQDVPGTQVSGIRKPEIPVEIAV